MPRLSQAGQCGTRQSKKDPTQMKNGCTPMHADGHESGVIRHGRHRTTVAGDPLRCSCPCPIRVPPRASAPDLSCLPRRKQYCAAREPDRYGQARTPCTRTHRRHPPQIGPIRNHSGQNPMHREPTRSSRPEPTCRLPPAPGNPATGRSGSVGRCARRRAGPHAPERQHATGTRFAQSRQDPMHREQASGLALGRPRRDVPLRQAAPGDASCCEARPYAP